MSDRLSQTFAALANPTRRAILVRLSMGESNISELAEPFLEVMSLPAVTKHLKVLEDAGLISKGRDAQWRPCRLNGEALKPAADWMDQYRKHWEESLDRLDEYLKSISQSTDSSEKTAKKGKKRESKSRNKRKSQAE